MNHGSLFSGIGGFDIAAEKAGWTNIFHCEIKSFCNKILKYYWPKAISYEDIKTTDFTIHRGQIDVLTGGFPCQPFSIAGKRKGTADHRNLWPEMFRAIHEIQPVWIVGENVLGIINWSEGLVFEQVQADLENEGYEVLPVILPACSVNAPHKRDRIWFIAYSESNHKQWNRIFQKQQKRKVGRSDSRIDKYRIASNTNISKRRKRRMHQTEFEKTKRHIGTFDARFMQRDWQNLPTQSPICSGNDELSPRLDGITFSKWRNESIKAYGNAIVPQVAYQIFKVINEMSE
ncbi:MAG: DNA cytosine methyltransferase [Promethearchaeota archaeon]